MQNYHQVLINKMMTINLFFDECHFLLSANIIFLLSDEINLGSW